MTHEDIAAALSDRLADESEVTFARAVDAVAEVVALPAPPSASSAAPASATPV